MVKRRVQNTFVRDSKSSFLKKDYIQKHFLKKVKKEIPQQERTRTSLHILPSPPHTYSPTLKRGHRHKHKHAYGPWALTHGRTRKKKHFDNKKNRL